MRRPLGAVLKAVAVLAGGFAMLAGFAWGALTDFENDGISLTLGAVLALAFGMWSIAERLDP